MNARTRKARARKRKQAARKWRLRVRAARTMWALWPITRTWPRNSKVGRLVWAEWLKKIRQTRVLRVLDVVGSRVTTTVIPLHP